MTGRTPGERGPAQAYAFRVSRVRRLHASVVAFLLSMIGLGVVLFGEGHVRDHVLISAICVALSVAVLLLSWGAWSRGTVMTIDDAGLWCRDWDLPSVPWRYVSGARTAGVRLRPLLRVDLRNAELFFATLDVDARRKSRGNALVKSDHLLIPGSAVEEPLSEIAALIRERASG